MMMMDESPLRPPSMEVNGAKPELPKLNGGFSFGAAAAPSSLFGQQAAAASGSTGFGFGAAPSATASMFGAKPAETKPAEKPAMGGFFGQQPGSAGLFQFGQKPETAAPTSTPTAAPFGSAPASTTAGGFNFGQKAPEAPQIAATTAGGAFNFASPATPTAATSPFGFGAPQIAASTSFGPASAGSNAPASPFGQTAPGGGFNFPATPTSATNQSNPFHFGSQPASPATANAGLPAQSSTGGFTFGASSTPFGEGASFTMGSVPTPTPGSARPMRKLPTRRGGKR